MIAISTAPAVSTERTYVMRHILPIETENEVLVQEVRRRGYKKVAVVTTTHEGLLALRKLFQESSPAKIVSDIEIAHQDLDLKTTAATIKQAGPDALYLLTINPQGGMLAKELRRLGFKGDFFSAHQIEIKAEVKLSEGALVGAWFVTGGSGRHAFFPRYEKRYGEPPTQAAQVGYDIVKMLLQCRSVANLNRCLHELKDFEGSMGRYSAVAGNRYSIPAQIKVITAQGFESVE
jgi:ABC-type branched-subunit amino acid transport system substrate-binding protein